ncbi:MAG: hypothetical protein QOI80_1296 [Solirubrobacteraceae bacterium]|jgi:hypothetical protein|nr:hypothetical protein [Solirubrobacteraceae bacterium]
MARRRAEKLRAPDVEYRSEDGVLVLRAAMTPKTRMAYREIGGVREDAWQRQVEFLFERLAVSWTIADAEPLTRQRDLLARYRFAVSEERAWIRAVLREHVTEHFPELPAP